MSDTIKIIDDLQKQNELLREQNEKLLQKAIKLDCEVQRLEHELWSAKTRFIEEGVHHVS